MSDRELLELAAKAAGIEGEYSENIGEDWGRYSGKAGIAAAHGRCWNPLTDDGDALRLAVKLAVTLERDATGDENDCVYAHYRTGSSRIHMISEPLGTDKDAAARRVIVRAAAEIGKAMP